MIRSPKTDVKTRCKQDHCETPARIVSSAHTQKYQSSYLLLLSLTKYTHKNKTISEPLVLNLLIIHRENHREFTDTEIFFRRSYIDISDSCFSLIHSFCGFIFYFYLASVCCLSVFNLFKDYSLISHGHRFQNPAMERPIDSLCCFMASPLSLESISQLQCVGKPLCECV